MRGWALTVEDRKSGVPRIDKLREIDATIRFLSVEPLIEDIGEVNLKNIHWVIVGGAIWHEGQADEA